METVGVGCISARVNYGRIDSLPALPTSESLDKEEEVSYVDVYESCSSMSQIVTVLYV